MKDYRKFQALHFFRFLGDALFYAFLTLYFKSLDFSPWKLGTLLAIVPLMAIAGSIVLGKLSGNPKRNLLMLKIVNILEAVFMIFFGFIRVFPLLVIFDIIVSFCNKSFYSLLDAAAMDVSQKAHKNYSNIRIFGSVAYLISSFAGGYLIDLIDFKFVFMLAGSLFLVAGIFMFTVKIEGKASASAKSEVHLKTLFKNRSFVFYLLFYVFALGASNVSDNIYALYSSSLGLSQANYGMVFSMMVAFEIITMLVVTKFARRNSYKWLLVVSALLIALRNALLAIPLPLAAVALIPALRGIAWGMMLAVHLNTLALIVDSKHLTKAIFVLNIFLQLFNTVFNQVGPKIIETSYVIMFSILGAFAALGFVFILILKLRNQDQQKTPPAEA